MPLLAIVLQRSDAGSEAPIQPRRQSKPKRPPTMANVLTIGNRLNRHDHPVHDTRPHREPDEASVRHWIMRRNNQEHGERGVDTQDHFEIFRATCCVPSPARRPEDGERPYAERKISPTTTRAIRRYL